MTRLQHNMPLSLRIALSSAACCVLLTSCGSTAEPEGIGSNSTITSEYSETESSDVVYRDNTPKCLVPEAAGVTTYGDDIGMIDASNVNEGYVMVAYNGDNEKPKLQISGPKGVDYFFDLHGGYETFPLTEGSGTYSFTLYEHVGNGNYSTLLEQSVDVSIGNEFLTYLYPNQYVNFDSDTKAVALGAELTEKCVTDLDAVSNIYNFVTSTITYDYDEAENVTSDYLPDIDEILDTKKGICFDYAALMACMLRSQQIPTRLEVGYAGDVYHAWISTYIDDIGWVNGIIEFDGVDWKIMDPTLASTNGDKKIKDFVGDGSNYMTKFVY